ncbi:uncharacterized protein [Littorina saxatilis]
MHYNRVPYAADTVSGHSVFVTQPPIGRFSAPSSASTGSQARPTASSGSAGNQTGSASTGSQAIHTTSPGSAGNQTGSVSPVSSAFTGSQARHANAGLSANQSVPTTSSTRPKNAHAPSVFSSPKMGQAAPGISASSARGTGTARTTGLAKKTSPCAGKKTSKLDAVGTILQGFNNLCPNHFVGNAASYFQSIITRSKQDNQPSQPSQHSIWTPEPQPATAPDPVYDSDVRDDFAQHHVLTNLQALGHKRGEVMFILSQLNFADYFNKPTYAAAAKRIPRLANLPKSHRQGDFDVMVFHRHHGILLGELKSVGKNHAELHKTQADSDADVAKRVEKAAKQLDKSETVIKHLVKDIASGLTVKKSIFLPYVRSAQLQRVLASNPNLERMVCQSLGAVNAADATQLCLCSEQLSDPDSYWRVTPEVLLRLDTWWQNRVACTVDPLLHDQLYLEIVTRFVGPATTVNVHCNAAPRVEVRTEGEAVSELGQRVARLILTLQQLDLLHLGPQHVWITGPPGTGKTLVLVLRGLWCLRHGHNVHIVSVVQGHLGVAHVIYNQLQMTVANDPPSTLGSVYLHTYALQERPWDCWPMILSLGRHLTSGKRMFVILDDVLINPGNNFPQIAQVLHQAFNNHPKAAHVSLWVSSMQFIRGAIPGAFPVVNFTQPMRCAPAVQREVEPGLKHCKTLGYSRKAMSAPGDGLEIVRLRHSGTGHTSLWPVDCYPCGVQIANVLRRQFNVSNAGQHALPTSPPPLEYNDVFILTRSSQLWDDIKDDKGRLTSPACALVRGLRDGGLPILVLDRASRDNEGWQKDMADTALARSNVVTITHSWAVRGLERKLVVWIPGRKLEGDPSEGDADCNLNKNLPDAEERLLAKSRCTTQLVIVELGQAEEPLQEPDLD